MDDRLEVLQARLDALSDEVAALSARLGALESGRAQPRPRHADDESGAVQPGQGFPFAATLAGAGRTFLVLGGAFLLRTITDAGWVPRPLGLGLGLGYALIWAAQAARAAARDPLGAGFHALASALIAYPLAAEATITFHVLPPRWAAAGLALLAASGFALAWARNLPSAAWVHALAAGGTLTFLLFRTHDVVPFAAVLLAVGLSTAWIGSARGWNGPRWFVAVAADVVIAWAVSVATDPGGPSDPYAAILPSSVGLLALALPLAYLGVFALHAGWRAGEVGAFEILQSAVALSVGYGGASRIARSSGADDAGLGVAGIAAGLACYAVSFAVVRRRQGRSRGFLFFTSIALVLVLAGAAMTASPDTTALATALLALVTAAIGGRFDRVTLRAHAAVYALYASVESGLIRFAGTAFLAPPPGAWSGPTRVQTAVVGLLLLAYLALVLTRKRRAAPKLVRVPRFTIGLFAITGLAAAVLAAGLRVAFPVAGVMGAGHLAVGRSVVLAGAAVLLGATRRMSGLREAAWPVYPLLVVGGAKLVLEDIPHGSPGTLFLAFAAYGAALLVAPRLLRGSPSPAAAPTAGT